MSFLDLVRQHSQAGSARFVALAAAAGVSNTLILALVNTAAQQAARQETRLVYGLLIVAAIAAYVWSQRRVMLTGAREVEGMVDRVRMALIEDIRRAELRPLERLDLGEIHGSITSDTETVSRAANMIMMGAQSALLVAFSLVYLALIAPVACILSVGVILAASRIHLGRMPRVHAKFGTAMAADARLFDDLDDALAGVKEIKMNSLRRQQVAAAVATSSSSAADARTDVQESMAGEYVFAQVLFFTLLGAMVFILPGLTLGRAERTSEALTAMLFLAGSLGVLLQAIPMWAQAEAAARRLAELRERLRASADAPSASGPVPAATPAAFVRLRLDGVTFAYEDESFRVGPLDLTVERGEILFLVGGNGSGKSTLLKLLAGLYPPQAGRLLADGGPVGDGGRDAYRALVSSVFSDFHLFARPYGVPHEPERVQTLLHLLGLQGIVNFDGRRFDPLDLSTGQRKRLALVVALLEDRPVLILDEWAADQDPASRRRFYRELLPELRAGGKTIILATHDDQYFDAADRVLRMEYGQIIN
jgi:putative ATP-binding cassette transporter